jgi:maintenance of morphology protein 1
MYELLSKVHYEIDSHPAETIDWLNVIVAQALAGYRQDMHSGGWSHGDFPLPAAEQGSAREWVETVLNTQTIAKGISFLDPIEVTHIDLGDSYPILSNAKVRPADDLGRMRVEVDLDFHDCIAIAIETKLVFNMPRPRFAVLPLSLGLTIERFSGTLAIELFSNTGSSMLPTPSTSSVPRALRSRHELHFSLHPDFSFDASASSLVGSRAKLQDLPKIEQLLVDRIRNYIHERFVWPRYWSVSLPNLISKRGNGTEGIANGGPDAPKASQMTEEEKASNLPNVDAPMRDAQHDGSESSEIIQADHSIPGTLPLSVEAWREHSASMAAANMSIHRDIRRRR